MVRRDLERALERGVLVAQANQLDHAADDTTIEGLGDLRGWIVVALDRAPVA